MTIDNEKTHKRVMNTARNLNHLGKHRTYLRIATAASLRNVHGK